WRCARRFVWGLPSSPAGSAPTGLQWTGSSGASMKVMPAWICSAASRRKPSVLAGAGWPKRSRPTAFSPGPNVRERTETAPGWMLAGGTGSKPGGRPGSRQAFLPVDYGHVLDALRELPENSISSSYLHRFSGVGGGTLRLMGDLRMGRNDYDAGFSDRITSAARIDFAVESHHGVEQECVYACCLESGDENGPIWGTGEASIKRALAGLTETCSCGAD